MISVLIPCYNSSKTILRTLRSLFDTNFRDFEIVIVDDGSTDDSGRKIQDYCEQNSIANIKLIRQENRGLAKAISRAVKEADGDYILCLDADDYVDKDYLQILSRNSEGFDVLAFGHKKVTPEGKLISVSARLDRIIKDAEIHEFLPHIYFDDHSFSAFQFVHIYRWNLMCKKAVVQSFISIYDDMNMSLYEDLVYTMLAIANAKSLRILNYSGLNYVQYPQSHSKDHQNSFEDLLSLREKLRQFLHDYSAMNQIDEQCFSTMEFDVSKFYFSRYCLRHSIKESRKFFKKLKSDSRYQEEKQLVSLKNESKMRKIYFFLLKHDLFLPIYFYFHLFS